MRLAFYLAIMTLRITRVEAEEGTLMRVDGRLEDDSVTELERACAGVQLPLTLSLEGVRWVDDRALEALRLLIANGAVVTNASPYVSLRMKSEDEKTRPQTEGGEL
mgnify:FL=1